MTRETIRVEVGPEWRRVVKMLGVVIHSIPDSARGRLHDAAEEASHEAALAVMDVQITTPGARTKAAKRSRGTRARIARGLDVKKTGPAEFTITTAMPIGEEMLPRGFASHWVRPVFGTSATMLSVSNDDWFGETIARNRPEMAHAVKEVLDDAAERVASVGSKRVT